MIKSHRIQSWIYPKYILTRVSTTLYKFDDFINMLKTHIILTDDSIFIISSLHLIVTNKWLLTHWHLWEAVKAWKNCRSSYWPGKTWLKWTAERTKFIIMFPSRISSEKAMHRQSLPVSDGIASASWYINWNMGINKVKHNLMHINLELNQSFVQIGIF